MSAEQVSRTMARLVPMKPEEFDSFIERSDRWYAANQVRIGTWEEDEALSLAQAETRELLPKGFETPDHHFRVILDDQTGERVGDLWFYTRHRGRRRQLFVAWIGIDPEVRRRGHATNVLGQLEVEARKLGADWIALATAGDNEAALSLYSRLGFQPKDIFLAKPVGK
jgi:ribosomal protein S18 acetylase RimI-like enzyme